MGRWISDNCELSSRSFQNQAHLFEQAYFLVWLEKRFDNPLLVPRLNMMMLTENWDDGKHFEKLLNGQDVEKLWEIYKQSFDKVSDDAPPAIPTHSVGYRPAYA